MRSRLQVMKFGGNSVGDAACIARAGQIYRQCSKAEPMRHNFIWGIADDFLRDLYVRCKYRDVILPMMVLRRLDAILESTKKAVMEMKAALDARKLCTRTEARFGCREARAFLKTNLRVMLRKRIPRTPRAIPVRGTASYFWHGACASAISFCVRGDCSACARASFARES